MFLSSTCLNIHSATMSITMAESWLLSHPSLLYTKTKFPIISNSVKPFKLQNPSSLSCNNNSSTFSPSLPLITGRRRITITRHYSLEDFYADENLVLFVENLPDNAFETLSELFGTVGEVMGVEMNFGDVPSLNYATISMKTAEEIEKTINKFNGYEIDGKLLIVSRKRPIREKPKPQPPPPVYGSRYGIKVRNMPEDVDSGRLEKIFSKYGKVVSVNIVHSQEMEHDGPTGYLRMADETNINSVIAALDTQEIDVTRVFAYPLWTIA